MGTSCLFGCITGKLEFNWMYVFISLNKKHNNWNFHLFSPLSCLRVSLLNPNCGVIPISTGTDNQNSTVVMQLKYRFAKYTLIKNHANKPWCVGTNEEGINEGE